MRIVEPNEYLIADECNDMYEYLCRDDENEEESGIIDELFMIPSDSIIQREELPYNYSTTRLPSMFTQIKNGQDYKNELEEYIATTEGKGFYEFEISNLRPNECKWLSYGMLIKPQNGEVMIRYRIRSQKSLGDLGDTLTLLA